MRTKTKTLVSIDNEILKDTQAICKAMSMKVSTFTENLYRAFIDSQKKPNETVDQLIKRIKKEYQSSVKRDKIIVI